MYVLTRDITANGRTFAKGTTLHSIYELGFDGLYGAMVKQHKLTLNKGDFEIEARVREQQAERDWPKTDPVSGLQPGRLSDIIR